MPYRSALRGAWKNLGRIVILENFYKNFMEIKEIQEEINKKIREASLTKDEKSAMFERIINSPRPSPYVFILSRWKFASRSFIYAAICIVFVFASGSGVISYSSSALPGESLYNFKVGIVEPAQGTFTFTS